jgi:hypothetical protein
MAEITRALIARVGVDLAKNVIQVHAVDAAGRRVVTRAFKREQFLAWCAQLPGGCLVAMEACSSAHHFGRKLRAMGLDARLIAASFVSPYRMEGKSGKNDMTDAAAICEAASRPTMRFVPIKSCEQQGVMSLHRVREGFKQERTGCINQIRGVLGEFGLVFGKSAKVLRAVIVEVIEDASNELNGLARLVVHRALERWRELDEHLRWCDVCVWPWHLELSRKPPEHRVHGEDGGCDLHGGDGVCCSMPERRRHDRVRAQAGAGRLDPSHQRDPLSVSQQAATGAAAALRSGCSTASAAGSARP